MTQPKFVPIAAADQVRPALRLDVPEPWSARRPGEIRYPARPGGRTLGAPGPDQGFALALARRFESQLVLAPSEVAEDVLLGCALVASRRSAMFGRAPCVHDLTVVFGLFGLLVPVPADLGAARAERFRGVTHGWSIQRQLVDSVPESMLRLAPSEIPGPPDGLRQLLAGSADQPEAPGPAAAAGA